MRRRYILYLLFGGILLADCATHKKVKYVFPEYIKEDRQPALIDMCEKGRTLYEANCAKCHGIFTKGKDGIPNFTNQQIDNYTAYAIKRDPKNHAVAANMSPDQLSLVFMFLRYRKKKEPVAKLAPQNQKPVDTLGK